LVHRLHVFATAAEPARVYARFYGRKDANLDVLENPLLYVPTHPARDLDRGLQAAGIQRYAAGGKIDFRFVSESGVSVKEAQVLARHATPQLTMNVYGRACEERLSQAAEKVVKTLLLDEERAIYLHQKSVGVYEKAATPANDKELRPIKTSGGGGNRTRVRRSLAEGFYMRSRCLKVRSALPPSAGAWGQASPAWISRPTPLGGEWLASPLHDALSHPAGESRKDVAGVKQPVPVLRWQLWFPICFTSQWDLGMPPSPQSPPSKPVAPLKTSAKW
jgi:hypothetical protein